MDPEVAIPALTDGLRDASADVRSASALALNMVIPDAVRNDAAIAHVRPAATALFEALKDPQPNVRSAAAQALWTTVMIWPSAAPVIDPKAVFAALTGAATDPDPAVRGAAVQGLGAMAVKVSAEPPPALVAALEDASEPNRAVAVDALVNYRRRLVAILPSVLRAFENARPECRPSYVALVERIRPRIFTAEAVPALTAALRSSNPELRYAAATALGRYQQAGWPAIPDLAACLDRDDRAAGSSAAGPFDPVLAAAKTLQAITPSLRLERTRPQLDSRSLEVVATVIRRGRKEVRLALLRALGGFAADPAMIPLLDETVRDSDAELRAAALRSLDELGHAMPFVPPESVHAALEDDVPDARYWAAGAIGHAGRGIDPFLPRLLSHAEHDAAPSVRDVCAWEISHNIPRGAVTPAVVPLLIEALDGPRRHLVCAVCALLARLGPDGAPAVPTIIRRFEQSAREKGEVSGHSSDDDIQSAAAAALGALAPGTPHAEEAVTVLLKALEADPQHQGTVETIKALGRLGPAGARAVPAIIRLLKENMNENAATSSYFKIQVRHASAEALGALAPGTPQAEEAVAALQGALRIKGTPTNIALNLKDDATIAAIQSLARFGPVAASALPRLRELQQEPNTDIKKAASQAISTLEQKGVRNQ